MKKATYSEKWAAIKGALPQVIADQEALASQELDPYMLGHYHGSIDMAKSILETMEEME